jgi:phage terminase large subunit-like protein
VCGCALTAATTSYGWDVIDFARDVLETPLDPWEQYLVVHAGELLPDGRPRFRTVLAIVARQNGKSFLLRTLILYWMFVERQPLTLATSTDRGYAKKAWMAAVDVATDNEHLARAASRAAHRQTDRRRRTSHRPRCKYKFSAVNRRTGRSLSIDRVVLDEIREHANFDAWGAATNAMNARPAGQVFAVSNQGDDAGVVLDWLRGAALAYLETGVGDRRLGLFEWSAPPGSDPTDLRALCAANPNAGHRLDLEACSGPRSRPSPATAQPWPRSKPKSCACGSTSWTRPSTPKRGGPAAAARPTSPSTVGGSRSASTSASTARTPR